MLYLFSYFPPGGLGGGPERGQCLRKGTNEITVRLQGPDPFVVEVVPALKLHHLFYSNKTE